MVGRHMQRQTTIRTAWIVACLAFPPISGAVVYVISRDTILTLVALLSVTFISWMLTRYVLVRRTQARLLAVTHVITSGFFFATAVAMSRLDEVWHLVYELLGRFLPWLTPPPSVERGWGIYVVALGIVAAVVFVAWLIIRAPQYESINIRKSGELDRKAARIIRSLTDHLNNLDGNLRFFDFPTTAIEPNLERSNSTSRFVSTHSAEQVVSMAEDGQFIVVKGEPGSGKSVMLRNLTRQLLTRAAAGGKFPLLLNLKEWRPPSNGSSTELSASLEAWAKSEYALRTGARPPSDAALEFRHLYEEGGFVFLFDSFDEIPLIDKSVHNGVRVRRLSTCLADFVRSSGGCVGLVFSRDYKAPVVGWIDHEVYVVRPFTDGQIREYIKVNCVSTELLDSLFRERVDLYSMAKNPLLLALLVDYCNRRGRLPTTEFDIFESFVSSRISGALSDNADTGLTEADVYATARRIARVNARIREPKRSASVKAADVSASAVLRSARLLKGDRSTSVFSHKRFQEFFRVLGMLEKEEPVPSLAPRRIDENRDVLTLFAQICSEEAANDLADQAHTNMLDSYSKYETSDNIKHYETVVLSLRFLKGAFRNRPDVLDCYRTSIRNIVVKLWNSFDILKQKHAVEHLSIIPPVTASNLVRYSMYQPVGWLRRVALWQARYLSSLQPWLGRCMAAYLSKQRDEVAILGGPASGVTQAMSMANVYDRVAVRVDFVSRLLIIAIYLAMILSNDLLIGSVVGSILLLLYLIMTFTESPSASDGDFFVRNGFNIGLSGFVALNVLFLVFWNMVGNFLDDNYNAFWEKEGALWFSILFLSVAITMWSNNFISRRRDALNELGEVPILSSALLKVERPNHFAVIQLFRNNWIFFGFFAAFVIAHTVESLKWIMIILSIIFIVFVVSLFSKALLGVAKSRHFVSRDSVEIQSFERHFSGMRSEIQVALNSVHTDEARLTILSVADRRAQDLVAKLADESNVWPDGQRPKYGSAVDGYLAMLDERWWGL